MKDFMRINNKNKILINNKKLMKKLKNRLQKDMFKH